MNTGQAVLKVNGRFGFPFQNNEMPQCFGRLKFVLLGPLSSDLKSPPNFGNLFRRNAEEGAGVM